MKDGQSYEDGQLLVDHLRGVRDIALKTNEFHGLSGETDDIISTICMGHDFGKASIYFQKYLKGEYSAELKNHGEISAYFTYYLLPEPWKLTGFMCVKKHHGNLEPSIAFFETNSKQLNDISKGMQKHVEELNCIYGQDISPFFEQIKDESFLRRPRLDYRKKVNKTSVEDFIWIQYLWSLLLTADKTQLIRGTAYENKTNVFEDYVKRYQEKIKEELIRKWTSVEKTKLFCIRNQIYREVMDSILSADLKSNHIFSINVPTGTGKTISVYGAAFKLLERIYSESKGNIKPTIIYTIPFTSVIDQNYHVLEDILKTNEIGQYESFILKHHSMTELKYNDYNEKIDEAKEYRNYDARFCVENWQSTIVTTTFVQLFDTIFQSGVNAVTNRFHKLAGSIIILDEVQAIPPKYYDIIEKIMETLCDKFNCYVISVTATKPLLLQGVELVKNNEEMFKQLDRIQIENYTDQPMVLNDFSQIVKTDILKNPEKSFLIILNTVKSSLKILDDLRKSEELQVVGREILYLSTEIHPARRLEIIQKIKIDSNAKYILVSTQLIEAGVDLDFDFVYRDFSTIDSINQAAGRANRNAINGKGIVRLYSLINENHNGKKFAQYIYPQPLLDATKEILKNRKIIQEKDILDINKEYFSAVHAVKSKDPSKDLEEAIAALDFVKIRKLFKLIEEDYQKVDIIINYNDEAEKCLELIESGEGVYQDILNAWRTLNKYKVSVDKKEFDRINSKTRTAKGIHVLDRKYYDENTGIIRSSYEII